MPWASSLCRSCVPGVPLWNGACPFQGGKNVCLVLIWIGPLFHSIRLHMCLHMAMWACGFLVEPMSYNPLMSLILMPSLFKTNLMEAPSRWLIYLLICICHPHVASLFFYYTQIDLFTLNASNRRHFSKYLYFFIVWAGPKKLRSSSYLGFAMVSSFLTQLEKANSLCVTRYSGIKYFSYNCLSALLQSQGSDYQEHRGPSSFSLCPPHHSVIQTRSPWISLVHWLLWMRSIIDVIGHLWITESLSLLPSMDIWKAGLSIPKFS